MFLIFLLQKIFAKIVDVHEYFVPYHGVFFSKYNSNQLVVSFVTYEKAFEYWSLAEHMLHLESQ